MSKTYRGWAEIEDWKFREVRRQHKRKSSNEWKKEASQTVSTSGVFIIVNEWTGTNMDSGMEIVDGVYFGTYEDAQWRLASLAAVKDIQIEDDETSFSIEDQGHITYEEYYIQELEAK